VACERVTGRYPFRCCFRFCILRSFEHLCFPAVHEDFRSKLSNPTSQEQCRPMNAGPSLIFWHVRMSDDHLHDWSNDPLVRRCEHPWTSGSMGRQLSRPPANHFGRHEVVFMIIVNTMNWRNDRRRLVSSNGERYGQCYMFSLKGGTIVMAQARRIATATRHCRDRIVASGEAVPVSPSEFMTARILWSAVHDRLQHISTPQVLWDPGALASASFGVTSCFMGNCGLSSRRSPPRSARSGGPMSRVEAIQRTPCAWDPVGSRDPRGILCGRGRFPLTPHVASLSAHNTTYVCHGSNYPAARRVPEKSRKIRPGAP